MATDIRSNGITEGVIWKQLLKFFFPIVLGTFFQQLYNTVDAVVVGQYVGKEALAAVGGTTGCLINLLVGFFVGLTSGATVVISQYYGAKDGEGVSKSVHTSIALALAGGLALTVVGFFLVPEGLRIMNTPEEIIRDSKTYIQVYFLGVIPMLVYNMGSSILRAIGDSKRPLYILIVCCIINIALDLLFVKTLGMGVAGVALATMIAQIVSGILVMLLLMKSDDCYRFRIRSTRFDGPILRHVLRIGFPAGLQSMLFTVSNLYIQSSVNIFGTDIIAGWTTLGKVDSLVWMVLDAFGISITTFVGQNIGAGKTDRVKRAVLVCGAMAMAFCLLFSGAVALFGDAIMSIFSSDAGVITAAMMLMGCLYPFYIIYVPVTILGGTLRGAGDSFRPMIFVGLGICLFRTIWIAVTRYTGAYVTFMVYSYPASWLLTSSIFITYYLKGNWMRRARRI